MTAAWISPEDVFRALVQSPLIFICSDQCIRALSLSRSVCVYVRIPQWELWSHAPQQLFCELFFIVLVTSGGKKEGGVVLCCCPLLYVALLFSFIRLWLCIKRSPRAFKQCVTQQCIISSMRALSHVCPPSTLLFPFCVSVSSRFNETSFSCFYTTGG